MTPLHVPVEIAARDMRFWRLSEAIDGRAIRFAREVPFDRGTRVRLSLVLPGGAAVRVDGECASANEVRFAARPPEDRTIEAYMQEQADES